MSARADAARERRWKARGHARLTARITRQANDALHLLAAHYMLDQRQVVQGLLLAAGNILLSQGKEEVIATMREHHMSRNEAEFFLSMRCVDLTANLHGEGRA